MKSPTNWKKLAEVAPFTARSRSRPRRRPSIRLTDGGPSVTPELSSWVAARPFGGAPCSAATCLSPSEHRPYHVGGVAVDAHHAHPKQSHMLQVKCLLQTADIERLPTELRYQFAHDLLRS